MNTNGDFNWKKTFGIENIVLYDEKPLVNVKLFKGGLTLIYLKNGNTVFQKIPMAEEQKWDEQVVLTQKHEENSILEHWFNNSYLSWSVVTQDEGAHSGVLECVVENACAIEQAVADTDGADA